MRLIDVRRSEDSYEHLYQLLNERDESVNIRHRKMPSWKDHVKFVNSNPYQAWYLIKTDEIVGATYLTNLDEIGVFIFLKHRGKGYGPQAVRLLMERHPRERFLANINPDNPVSMAMFGRLGFVHVQNTYALEV